jgi:phosphoribosyl-AMP cyclohydrolase
MGSTDTSQDLAFADQLKWDAQGLVPAIAQDWQSGEILMLAWMNRESLQLSIQEGRAVYWSRSRKALWRKGEESGHVQRLKEVRIDCDADTILIKVEQIGGIACHTGRRSCFYRKLERDQWQLTDDVIRPPADIYGDRK